MPNEMPTSSAERRAAFYEPPKPHERLPGLCPNTTSRSFLHWLARYDGPDSQRPRLGWTYLAAAATAYLPVLVAVLFSSRRWWAEEGTDALPFFRDWGFAYGLLISLPAPRCSLRMSGHSANTETDGTDGVIEPSATTSASHESLGKTIPRGQYREPVGWPRARCGVSTPTLLQYLRHPTHSWIATNDKLDA
jgi:hypothetical protein